jgi:hypothetical protein
MKRLSTMERLKSASGNQWGDGRSFGTLGLDECSGRPQKQEQGR